MKLDTASLDNEGLGIAARSLCLGCMSFGRSRWRSWVLDAADSLPILDAAITLTDAQIERLEQPYRALPQVALPYSAKNQTPTASLPRIAAS